MQWTETSSYSGIYEQVWMRRFILGWLSDRLNWLDSEHKDGTRQLLASTLSLKKPYRQTTNTVKSSELLHKVLFLKLKMLKHAQLERKDWATWIRPIAFNQKAYNKLNIYPRNIMEQTSFLFLFWNSSWFYFLNLFVLYLLILKQLKNGSFSVWDTSFYLIKYPMSHLHPASSIITFPQPQLSLSD